MKFEEQMKDKLDRRKIEPSENAWEAIASQINTTKRPGRPNSIFWYGIAAGFIGVVLVSSIYIMGRGKTATEVDQVVDTENVQTSSEKQQLSNRSTEQQGEKQDKNIREKNILGSIAENSVANEKKDNESNISDRSKTGTRAVAGQITGESNGDLPLQTQEVIDSKISQMMEQIGLLEQNQVKVTDVEIDSLMRGAQQEIIKEQLFLKNNTVDAMALLVQVEGEMDRTFRDQIFEALRDGFLKVRTAVASRNE
ncbi:hypothetical protein [Sediminicola sp. 1XM1-17]|uniref:hypothetical protein n=1 Tax=Sediminicola sp. 1XM1-17 TaxID=3127702 RepID=UPI003077DFF5